MMSIVCQPRHRGRFQRLATARRSMRRRHATEPLEAKHLLASVGQIDDFNDNTTMNWQEGPNSTTPPSVASPSVDGTPYLFDSSTGSQTAGGSAVVFNHEQWQGNYLSAGITRIAAHAVNLGNNRLFLRAGLGTFDSTGDPDPTGGYVTPEPVVLEPGTGWQPIEFDIDPANLVAAGTALSVNQVLANVAHLRIFSAAKAQWQGDRITSELGLDNIRALGAIERDVFSESTALVGMRIPGAGLINTTLRGPSIVDVFFEGAREGDARDDSGDGLDEVPTEMVQLDLHGSSSVGDIHMRLNPDRQTVGVIQENENKIKGRLDLPPFTGQGTANSIFDVFFEIEVPGLNLKLHNEVASRMESTITHKPPAPGDTYRKPQGEIELFDENGNATGIVLTQAKHVPRHFVEHDRFPDSEATMELISPTGQSELITVAGPTAVDVWFESREGEAHDDSGLLGDGGPDGLDEVMTKMVKMDLRGTSDAFGDVHVTLNPDLMTTGVIQEMADNTPGILDVAPFGPGAAISWFDLFVVIEVGDTRLFNLDPKHMRTRINHKPPGTGTVYENPDEIELWVNGPDGPQPSGYRIGKAGHVPQPHFVEHDHFEDTVAEFELITPTGSQTVELTGPTWIDVWFERREGEAQDNDGDGLDEVMLKVQQLDLVGPGPGGSIHVGLNPNVMSTGEIEEKVNNTPGILDLRPFADVGTANSWIELWLQVTVPGSDGEPLVLTAERPKMMHSMIRHKPPGIGDVYENPETIPLLLNGEPTGYAIGPGRHVPRPHFVEHDHFEETVAEMTLVGPNGEETIELQGPTWVDVWFERREGEARDDDGDGLDEVMTKMTGLDLWGSSSLGPVHVTLNPSEMSTGWIEEKLNNTQGVLDIPPFTGSGAANSHFDMFFQIEVAGQRLFNLEPKVMRSMITHKPPGPGDVYESPTVIPLFDAAGNQTEFALGPARHVPHPHFVEHDVFENTEAQFTLISPTGAQSVIDVSGTTAIDVWFERREGEALDDDGDGLDEVMTKVVDLELRGNSDIGSVVVELNPAKMSVGEIEEKSNNTAGILDIPPFTETGGANSSFEMWLQFTIITPDGETVLTAERPKIMRSMITHKPPGIGDTYENPDTIRLLLPNGEPSGYAIGPGTHVPQPHFVEHDHFEQAMARIGLDLGNGQIDVISLTGTTWIDVWFEHQEGEAVDDDGDGLDEVMTHLKKLEMRGQHPELGPVIVRLDPGAKSVGQIEELQNLADGVLDVAPFNEGRANGFFDIYVEIEVQRTGQVFHNRVPQRLSSTINHKPPGPDSVFTTTGDSVELYDESGEPTGMYIRRVEHAPELGMRAIVNNSEVQRSGITDITLWFSEPVIVQDKPVTDLSFFTLVNETTGNDVPLDDVILTGNGTHMLNLDFLGTALADPDDESANGVYTAWVDGDLIFSANTGIPLGVDKHFEFHRMLGDANGDRDVSAADIRVWLATRTLFDEGTEPYRPGDMNGDGDVSAADVRVWLLHRNTTLPAPELVNTAPSIVDAVYEDTDDPIEGDDEDIVVLAVDRPSDPFIA